MQNSNIDMKKVHQLTLDKLWTWSELARQANLTTATLYALKAGRRTPCSRTIYKIAKALDVDPKEIATF